MVRRAIFLILSICGLARADTGFTGTIKVTESDNAPSCVAGQLKFSNGTVTCSGQTATITNTGGGGGPNGTINNANQYSAGYYSVAGSSNVISGVSPVAGNNVLTSSGTAGPPYWAPASGSVTLISSGVAFGSPTNTVTQDTNTFTWNKTTKQLQIYGSSITASAYITHGKMYNSGFLTINQHYAYVTAFTSSSLTVFDIADPSNPVFLNQISGGSLGGAEGLEISGRYLFVVASSSNALNVFDISSPANPVLVATLQDAVNLPGAEHIRILGNYAYIADLTGGGFTVVDISTPTNPRIATRLTHASLAGPVYIQIRFPYAYVTNESDCNVAIVDISTPTVPTVAASFSPSGCATFNTTSDFYGKYLYIAGQGDDALYAVDISSPLSPVSVSSTTTGNDPLTVKVVGENLYLTIVSDWLVSNFSLADPSHPRLVSSFQDLNNLYRPDDLNVYGDHLYVTTHGVPASLIDGGLAILTLPSIKMPAFSSGSGYLDEIHVSHDVRANRIFADSGIEANNLWSQNELTGKKVTAGTLQGANLSSCADSTHGLGWSGGLFSCQNITGPGIVSPGTFTWTNNFGFLVSTITASTMTDTGLTTNNVICTDSNDAFFSCGSTTTLPAWSTTVTPVSTTVYIVSGTTWSAITDGSNIVVELIGGGGGGNFGSGQRGGGGGQYKKSTLSYVSGTVKNIQIGSGGAGSTDPGSLGGDGGDTCFDDCTTLKASGGFGGSSGGSGGAGGDVINNGGGSGSTTSGYGGTGGGGAGGPNGIGKTGGSAAGGTRGGGGGGGNGGGTNGSDATGGQSGGNGGDNSGSSGHGVGDTTGGGATAGTNGGGGGGGFGRSGAGTTTSGANGGAGTEWNATHGSGGGGGAGGGSDFGTVNGANGANGGLYGGGGGGGGFSTGGTKGNGGNGAQGILVITYNIPVTSYGFSPNKFVVTNSSNYLSTTDLFGSTNVWTGGNTLQSSTTVNGNVNISSGVLLSGTAGNNGQVLTSGGAGTIPTWTTPASGGSSALATALGSTTSWKTQISSPSAAVVMDQSQFNGQSLGSGTTAFFSIAYSSINVTTNYTTTPSTVSIVMANCSSACTITLSTPTYSGYVSRVIQAGTGNVTVSPGGGTISGGTTALMNQQYTELDVIWDGSNWWVK